VIHKKDAAIYYQQMDILKHVTFEIEEMMHLHSKAIDRGDDYSSEYLKLTLPLIAGVETGSFILVVTPLIPLEKRTIKECTLSSLEELEYENSPLPHMPLLSNIVP
jgi:hypothetical protein